MTPTPLPDRPDWEIKDWVEYFEEKHPNFWFLEQLKKNQTEAAKENEVCLSKLRIRQPMCTKS